MTGVVLAGYICASLWTFLFGFAVGQRGAPMVVEHRYVHQLACKEPDKRVVEWARQLDEKKLDREDFEWNVKGLQDLELMEEKHAESK